MVSNILKFLKNQTSLWAAQIVWGSFSKKTRFLWFWEFATLKSLKELKGEPAWWKLFDLLSFRCIWNLLYEVLYQFCNRQEFVDHFSGDQACQRGYFLRNMDSDDSANGGRVSSNDPESIASIPIGRIHNSWFEIPYDMGHMIWPYLIELK